MNISRRLNRLAELVTEGSRLADVGTDHGYVPLCLCREKKIPSAIAMDINKGPLERAKSHIAEAGLEHCIETRLSDGLQKLQGGEADCILIAGMGGALMVRILSEGAAALIGVRELVLQPQSEIGDVRQWLNTHGWRIATEDILLDEGKYYPMFRAVPGEAEAYTEAEYRFGKLERQESPQVLADFLQKRLEVNRQIAAELPKKDEERIAARRSEVAAEMELLTEVLQCIEVTIQDSPKHLLLRAYEHDSGVQNPIGEADSHGFCIRNWSGTEQLRR